MSRIGKKPIPIPEGVTFLKEGDTLRVKGPKGELERHISDGLISFELKDSELYIHPIKHTNEAKRMWGTYASHVKNMLRGVTEGFEKRLEIEGIGYRAEMRGGELFLNLGFSHPVTINLIKGVDVRMEKNVIVISGLDKERVGEMAARIRALKKPEPYKGKGIRYQGEVIIRKAGKKAVTGG